MCIRDRLTSISGNADVLLDQGSTGTAELDSQTRRGLLLSIRSDALWLLSLIHICKWLIIPAMLGGAALLADGILTPAVTVTTAIELSLIHIFLGLLFHKPVSSQL